MRHSAISRHHWLSGRMSAEFNVRNMKRTILALFLVLAAFSAWPCSCNIGDVPEKFKNHVSVFKGIVKDIVFYKERDFAGDQYIRVTFEITKQWKGSPQQNQLLTVYNGASCFGYWFKKGETYLVYAFDQEDHLNAWWCGGVLSEKESGEAFGSDIRQLDRLMHKNARSSR